MPKWYIPGGTDWIDIELLDDKLIFKIVLDTYEILEFLIKLY